MSVPYFRCQLLNKCEGTGFPFFRNTLKSIKYIINNFEKDFLKKAFKYIYLKLNILTMKCFSELRLKNTFYMKIYKRSGAPVSKALSPFLRKSCAFLLSEKGTLSLISAIYTIQSF